MSVIGLIRSQMDIKKFKKYNHIQLVIELQEKVDSLHKELIDSKAYIEASEKLIESTHEAAGNCSSYNFSLLSDAKEEFERARKKYHSRNCAATMVASIKGKPVEITEFSNWFNSLSNNDKIAFLLETMQEMQKGMANNK